MLRSDRLIGLVSWARLPKVVELSSLPGRKEYRFVTCAFLHVLRQSSLSCNVVNLYLLCPGLCAKGKSRNSGEARRLGGCRGGVALLSLLHLRH